MRSSNKFAGYSYSLKRRRSSPFIRLGMLLAVAGAAMAGLSAWSGKQPDRGGAVGPLVLKPMQAHPVTQAHAATPLLRPSYVAGYVAQPLAESAPLMPSTNWTWSGAATRPFLTRSAAMSRCPAS